MGILKYKIKKKERKQRQKIKKKEKHIPTPKLVMQSFHIITTFKKKNYKVYKVMFWEN